MASICELRVSLNLSREQLAKMCNISTSAVRLWEIKETKPSLQFQKILFELFGEKPDECQYPRGPYASSTCLRNLRVKHKLTQTKLSEMLGVSDRTVSFWEVHGHIPSTLYAEKLTEIFGVTPEECKRKDTPELDSTSIRSLRKRLGLTQAVVSELCGRKRNTMSQWETGKIVPPPLIQQKLHEIFGIMPDECREAQRAIGSSTCIRALRKGRGLSQRKLSEALRVNDSTIVLWEHGAATPSVRSRIKLCKFFGIVPDECRGVMRGYSPTSIRTLRIERDLTLREVAEMCGVGLSLVAHWESMDCKPSPEHREKLREIFGVIPDECVERAEPKILDIKPDWHIGELFKFTLPRRAKDQKFYKNRPIILRLKSRTEKFLIFTDSTGSIHTFTEHQLRDFASITPASKQEIKKFKTGGDIFTDF